jgi:hypothetical protein
MNRKISNWPSHIRGARTAARILEKQDRLRVSQVFFSVSVHQPSDGLAFQGFYKARPLHPTGAAPNLTMLPLDLAGLRRGLARLGCILSATVYLGTMAGAYCAEPLANIDSALQKLALHAKQSMPAANVAGVHGQNAKISSTDRTQIPGRFDDKDRVLVHVHLDGRSSLDEVTKQLESLRGQVLDHNETYQHGILAAYLPTDQIENIAKIVGVRALTMEHRPEFRVGKVTSQGCAVLGTDVLNNLGLKGDGITVGVLSDSFDTARFNTSSPPATTADQDVTTGDLPVVKVVQDLPPFAVPYPVTDEGRAVCQIIYDEAPHCNLAFATAAVSEVGFANNIIALRTQAGCDVIVDDAVYFDEPVFSDGLVADAVNTVVNSKTLPGKPVIYISSAGNDGNNGYRDNYRDLKDEEVRAAGHHGNLNLDVTDPNSPNFLDPSLTAGGWHNWNPNGGFEPVTTVGAPGPTSLQYAIFLQWDDLFDQDLDQDQDNGITTNYNFLVFDQDGNYLAALSSTTNSFKTQQPIQATNFLSLGVNYQIAITKTIQTDPKAGPIPKTHQLAIYTTLGNVASNLVSKYFNPDPPAVPNIYGHAAADSAIAVAAYDFNWKPAPPYRPQLENFTSPGPVTIYFDQNNKRLAVPETRLKPEVAGVDGVITTFFGPGYYNYPFAFFGTSASAASVAGVVALMLQEAGGPGSLDVATVKIALENSAQPRTSTPEMTQALARSPREGRSGTGVNRDGHLRWFASSNTGVANRTREEEQVPAWASLQRIPGGGERSLASSAGFVSVTAVGRVYFGLNYFTVNYFGFSDDSIGSLTIDGSGAGLVFDTTSSAFAIGNTIGLTASDAQVEPVSSSTSKFTLKFKPGSFKSGNSISFTLGQDVAGTFTGFTQGQFGVGSEAEDLGSGATFTVNFADEPKDTVHGAFRNGFLTFGYSPFDGFGLINAEAALEAVVPAPKRLSQQ